mmetsp:Transcript_19277/g.57905  ORF Transcript_19277/g.57905 Transcript_19277/m.57905 type:complete len:80 (-) Transcript_19277:49-288(-)
MAAVGGRGVPQCRSAADSRWGAEGGRCGAAAWARKEVGGMGIPFSESHGLLVPASGRTSSPAMHGVEDIIGVHIVGVQK